MTDTPTDAVDLPCNPTPRQEMAVLDSMIERLEGTITTLTARIEELVILCAVKDAALEPFSDAENDATSAMHDDHVITFLYRYPLTVAHLRAAKKAREDQP